MILHMVMLFHKKSFPVPYYGSPFALIKPCLKALDFWPQPEDLVLYTDARINNAEHNQKVFCATVSIPRGVMMGAPYPGLSTTAPYNQMEDLVL